MEGDQILRHCQAGRPKGRKVRDRTSVSKETSFFFLGEEEVPAGTGGPLTAGRRDGRDVPGNESSEFLN